MRNGETTSEAARETLNAMLDVDRYRWLDRYANPVGRRDGGVTDTHRTSRPADVDVEVTTFY